MPMEKLDLELKLLAGLPISVEGIGMLTLPNLKKIIGLDESVYSQILFYLTMNKKYLKEAPDEDISNFDLMANLAFQDEGYQEQVSDGFEIFFNERPTFAKEFGFFYFGDLYDERIITPEKLEKIQEIIKKAHFMKEPEDEYADIKPGNERARKFLEKIKKNKEKAPKKKEKQNLHSLISGLAWKSNNLNINQVLNLNMYQLYDGYMRLESIDHYNSILYGIYSGVIDSKEIKLPDINWANIIKTN